MASSLGRHTRLEFESDHDRYGLFDMPRWWRARLNAKYAKLRPEEEWLFDDPYLGYGLDTPISRLRRPPRRLHVTPEQIDEAGFLWSNKTNPWCGHHTIRLNQCRYDHYHLPWMCDVERENLEKCKYKELKDLILLERDEKLRRRESMLKREADVLAHKKKLQAAARAAAAAAEDASS